jgi:hypothetical protein
MRPEQLEHTLLGHPCLAQYPVLDTSTAAASPVPIVSIVPMVPTTPATPDPANDQDTNSQATLVPTVPCVSTVTKPCHDTQRHLNWQRWRSASTRMSQSL